MNALPPGSPKFRRRPEDRPAEILAAALDVFSEHGFAATRMEEVARRAGVSKGAVYRYFETKEELFRAMVGSAILPNIQAVTGLLAQAPSFEDAVRLATPALARRILSNRQMTGVMRLIIAESRAHPELAELWHGSVVEPSLGLITGLIERAQARGEVRAGDPRLFAMGVMGPMFLSIIWRETFEPIGAQPVDLAALVDQHVETAIRGMRS
jgi:AcrR family transcriptional regulator